MPDRVFDASAILSVLRSERGHDRAAALIGWGGVVGSVNLVEVLTRLVDDGLPEGEALERFGTLGLSVVEFDHALALGAVALRGATRPYGLSLGDRACLALGIARAWPVATADRAWATIAPLVGVEVEVVR